MATDRERFLAAVRQAVAAGNLPGGAPPLPQRAGVGYQGAGNDAVQRFAAELAAAGGNCIVVGDRTSAVAAVRSIIESKSAQRVLLGNGPAIDALDLQRHLREARLQVAGPGTDRDTLFAADVGVTGVEYLIAETGSLVMRTATDQPRSFSLLPPVHIAVAERRQLLPDLFDLFETAPDRSSLPSCLTLITGPSKTGDIELRLVTGVHGPGEVHVVLIDGSSV